MHFQYRANFIEKNTVCQLFLSKQNRWRTYFLSLDGNNNVLRDLATFYKYIVIFLGNSMHCGWGMTLEFFAKANTTGFVFFDALGITSHFRLHWSPRANYTVGHTSLVFTRPKLLVIFSPMLSHTYLKQEVS